MVPCFMWSAGDFGEVLHNSVNQPDAAGLASLMPNEPCESMIIELKHIQCVIA